MSDGVLIKEDELGGRGGGLILLSPGIPKGRELRLNGLKESGLSLIRGLRPKPIVTVF
jgi:hypothetical protein